MNQIHAKRGFEPAVRDSVPPITVPTHNLTRYLRVRLEVEHGVMRWKVPRTLLGVIPLGTRRVEVPVSDIETVRIGRAVRWARLAIAAAIMIVPWFIAPWWIAVPSTLAGMWIGLVAMGPQLRVTTLRRRRTSADICFGHQFDADLYREAVMDLAKSARDASVPHSRPAGSS